VTPTARMSSRMRSRNGLRRPRPSSGRRRLVSGVAKRSRCDGDATRRRDAAGAAASGSGAGPAECAGRNSSSRPPGFNIPAASSKRFSSSLTARTVMKSAVPEKSASLAMSSNRLVCTLASASPSTRTASRRNAPLRSFDSIIVNRSAGRAILSGIAGDPPPDPKSNQTPGMWVGICFAAQSGSTKSRSNVSSVGGSSGSAVRLIVAFHCASSR